jgi:hypothetical protein
MIPLVASLLTALVTGQTTAEPVVSVTIVDGECKPGGLMQEQRNNPSIRDVLQDRF